MEKKNDKKFNEKPKYLAYITLVNAIAMRLAKEKKKDSSAIARTQSGGPVVKLIILVVSAQAFGKGSH